MLSRKTVALSLAALLLLSSAAALETAIRSSCQSDEIAAVSINSTTGGHIGPPGNFGNELCVSEVESLTFGDSCGTGEQQVFSLFNDTNSHFSLYTGYRKVVCMASVESTVRSSCLSNETAAFSVYAEDNSHVASPGHFDQELCLFRASPENTTLTLTGLSGTFYSDGEVISSGESRTLVEFPYILSEDSGVTGIVSYSDFVSLKREDDSVSITQQGSSFLIPYTTGGVSEIEDEQEEVLDRRFLELISPSFNYFIREEPLVKVVLKPDQTTRGFAEEERNYVEVTVENLGLDANDLVIEFRTDN